MELCYQMNKENIHAQPSFARSKEWFVVHFNQLTGTIPEDLNFGLNVVFDIRYVEDLGFTAPAAWHNFE